MMILEKGEKVHIVERRYFVDDIRRHFVGEVEICENHCVRLSGYVWVMDTRDSKWIRKSDKRTRVLFLGERLTMNIIPPEVNIDDIQYIDDMHKGLKVTDGKKFSLDVTEFTALR